jgi:hypothetical protein
MKSLKKVYLNENQIEDVEEFLKSDIPELQLFTVETNNLKTISKLPFP